MRFWIIKDGETLPIQAGSAKMRSWMLAEALVDQGHEVVWWSSTFLHARKELVGNEDRVVAVGPRFQLKLLHAGSYQRNVSLGRMVHHWRLADKFRRIAPGEAKPDLLVCCYPTIDGAYQAARYAKRIGIPLLIDIRDPWPATFLQVARPWLRPLVAAVLPLWYRRARYAFRQATGLVAMSQGVLDWGVALSGRSHETIHRVFPLGYHPPEEPGLPSDAIQETTRRLAGRLVLTFVGTLGDSYEFDLMVSTAARLVDSQNQQVVLVFAGDGSRYAFLQQSAQRYPNVIVTGWLSQADVHHLLQHSHFGMILNKNLTEGIMPNKLYLYMSNRLPVLSIVRGEMQALIANHAIGYHCPTESVEAMYALITRIASERSRHPVLAGNAETLFLHRYHSRIVYRGFADHVIATALPNPPQASD